ncbi:hypothetical protein AJ78_07490 [Emergomyces pasteurianus Ep9510]|uniref:Zn(2)-C6 fungal-type domain-containing protein n=1 Tax=Emergomyces pasteurianus Ep9510 TaxID=1447872 RepID=A0A1J9P5X7_9EURO|nr:hypothetical protein AJ78_07490 [Emergomyces pasteurianus Ep9510]
MPSGTVSTVSSPLAARVYQESTTSHRRIDRVFPRTRTGCFSCRRRKKKCDEVKPTCLACMRNKLDCSWPETILRGFRSQLEPQTSEIKRVSSKAAAGFEGDAGHARKSSSTHANWSTSSETSGGNAPEQDSTGITWSPRIATFLSPARAGLLLPASQILLAHYLGETGPLISPTPTQDTPFLSWIVPLSYTDDLLMHSVLAVSGSHLSFKVENNIEVEQATSQHYSLALRCLQSIIKNDSLLQDPHMLLRVVLVMIFLCHYEVLSGNLDGSLFTHLRASRHLILQLRDKLEQITMDSDRKLYGFVMELYGYIVLSNIITPYGMNEARTLVVDPFLQSFEDLRSFGAFGSMLCGSHNLFEMISEISIFSAQQGPPSPSVETDPDRLNIYNDLKNRIVNWDPPASDSPNSNFLAQRRAALEVYRHALLIFLETAISPLSIHDKTRILTIQMHIDVGLSHHHHSFQTTYSTILLWPLIIIGSCMVKKDQQRVMAHGLAHNHFKMKNTVQGGRLLELLWADDDEYAIGPYGLGLVMDKYNCNYQVL